MPIKQKSKKFEFEYQSPDGDTFVITFIENEDRKYIEIKNDKTEASQAYDFEMLRDIVYEMENSTSANTRELSVSNLPVPNVTDHRVNIDQQVSDSMQNIDPEAKPPVESFSPQGETSAKGELEAWDKKKEKEPEGVDATDLI